MNSDFNENSTFLEKDDHFFTKVLHFSEESHHLQQSQRTKKKACVLETLEATLASLDNGRYALCSASGLGACFTLMTMFEKGDHIICDQDVYFGAKQIFNQEVTNFGIETTVADLSSVDDVEKLIRPNTRLIYTESPSNPLLKITDIRKLANIAKSHNVMLAVDNTFLTSYLQRPLDLGADIVVYSLTKYMNGHTDVVMGGLVLNDNTVYRRLRELRQWIGSTPSEFDCKLIQQSIKTLPLRMNWHMNSAIKLAKFLQGHRLIEGVLHPGLTCHKDHKIALGQSYGHSGMFSFYLKGDRGDLLKFTESLKVFTIATSLGGCESLIQIPFLMSHRNLSNEEKTKMGIADNLIRVSVGLENPNDLVQDLAQALDQIKMTTF